MYIKSQDKQVRKIIKDYLKAIAIITCKEKGIDLLQDNGSVKLETVLALISKVELVLSLVEDETTFILYKEYMEKNQKLWWMEYYSRSTYYRHKARALTDFLNCYEN